MNKAPSISHNSGTDGIVSGLYLKDTTIQNNWQKTIKWEVLTLDDTGATFRFVNHLYAPNAANGNAARAFSSQPACFTQ